MRTIVRYPNQQLITIQSKISSRKLPCWHLLSLNLNLEYSKRETWRQTYRPHGQLTAAEPQHVANDTRDRSTARSPSKTPQWRSPKAGTFRECIAQRFDMQRRRPHHLPNWTCAAFRPSQHSFDSLRGVESASRAVRQA